MDLITIASHLGASSLALIGLGHTLTAFLGRKTAGALPVAAEMRRTELDMPGRRVTLWQLNEGFSYTMGFMLLAYGILNELWFIQTSDIASIGAPILLFNVVCSAAILALAIRYFFAVPIVFALISLAGFSTAAIMSLC